ncbi:vascular cell adhesion protein 1-like [Archocentrus centrarchus]|uniref:vascular cell adhesion protein 1-like n=1 Tax=Archocentrus centrarchus TaxID=63155 RepID=UPI0011EA2E72|nr:vascular cell adhesion protein 1-like [Archocentrus centrarchus]
MTAIMLLSLLFIPRALAACPPYAYLFITAPTEMEALSGSCLRIPCNFIVTGPEPFNSTRPVFGSWMTKINSNENFPKNMVYNSSETVNIYPMNITGNLKQKNCTTLFSNLTTTYTNTYYFRIVNWPFRATAVCDPLTITIKDSPWRPNITVSGDLKEKESVTITCSAFTPCPHSPPELTWNLQQDSHNKIEENTDGSFTTKIQQTITLSDTHDGKKINCSARYPVNQGEETKTAETEETLSVSYAPKSTSASISPSGLVSAGSWVNLTCSSRAKPPVSSFTWFKKSTDGPVNVSEGQIYSFNVTDGGVYYCVATNELGNQTSAEIHVIIKDSPWRPNITVSGDLKEKESVTITCSAFTPCPHSPPELTWNLQQDSHNKIEENTDGSFTTKIQQTITLSDTHDGKKINCSARYPVNQGEETKTAETEETLNVSYAPKNTSASISPSGLVSAGSWVNLTCSSRAKPPVSSFFWFKKSTDGPVNVSEGQIYSFNVTDGGVYYCVATNELGNQTSAEIRVNIEGQNSDSFLLWSVLGGITGFILLICFIIFVWRLKSKHQTQQQTQIQTKEVVAEEPASKIEGKEIEGNIHYGEISFCNLGYEASSDSVQDRGQQQDTVYAQVKVNRPENSLTQRAHGQEELYAEVKKK